VIKEFSNRLPNGLPAGGTAGRDSGDEDERIYHRGHGARRECMGFDESVYKKKFSNRIYQIKRIKLKEELQK
jgi:hypothetical protein